MNIDHSKSLSIIQVDKEESTYTYVTVCVCVCACVRACEFRHLNKTCSEQYVHMYVCVQMNNDNNYVSTYICT